MPEAAMGTGPDDAGTERRRNRPCLHDADAEPRLHQLEDRFRGMTNDMRLATTPAGSRIFWIVKLSSGELE
jgi:hypothetical protein